MCKLCILTKYSSIYDFCSAEIYPRTTLLARLTTYASSMQQRPFPLGRMAVCHLIPQHGMAGYFQPFVWLPPPQGEEGGGGEHYQWKIGLLSLIHFSSVKEALWRGERMKKRKFSDQLHGGTKEKPSKNIPRMKNKFFLTELSVFMKTFSMGFVYKSKST
jgi:hypothetical protein